MQYQLSKTFTPESQRTDCLVLGVFEDRRLSAAAKLADTASKRDISRLLRNGDMDGRIGQSLLLQEVPGILAKRVLLVGCGNMSKLDADAYSRIVAHSARLVGATKARDAVNQLGELGPAGMDTAGRYRQAVIATAETCYRFDRMKSHDAEPRTGRELRKVRFTCGAKDRPRDCKRGLEEGIAISSGVSLARDLGNMPPNICNPSWLASKARKLAKEHSAFKTRVLDEQGMKKLGMGSLLSVSQGSSQPARLIAMEYQGGENNTQPIVLVGKGVTFDTGGISLKPAGAMDEMKFDMCGAASVFGVLHAVAQLKLPVNLVGVVPATENMPGGKATRPGDIVTSLSGRTIEILNTDAEGRLILCDALTWCKRYKPDVVIDIATLTGACVIALGKHASGMLSNNRKLATALTRAGETSRDRVWELPLWEDYRKQLRSPFADVANIGGRSAGTITAACFLSYFTEDLCWAHLDIAGTAWNSGQNKGATGRPVRLLTQYILDRCR